MRVDVDNIEELIKTAHDEALFNKIYDIVANCMGDRGSFFKSESKMSMIGYKYIDYKGGKWPLVSIAPQKNNVSIYIFALEEEEYLVEKYAQEFGKTNIGKSCIRIKKLTSKREEVLREILKRV